jgi:hypothetical protein
MHVFVKHHQLGERITKLESTIHYPPTAAEQQEAETLMKLRMEGIKAANRVCWKFPRVCDTSGRTRFLEFPWRS